MLTGRVLALDEPGAPGVPGAIRRMVHRMGEPVIRTALRQGMRVLARQFVLGRTIGEAIARSSGPEGRRWRYSYDMLGEAARTAADAARYMRSYRDAIAAIGRVGSGPVEGPGVSVKLSALHPRYEATQASRCVPALIAALTEIARAARAENIGLTVDAEEADRLEISLDITAAVMADPALAGWDGLGLAIQAYQKRCLPLVDWVAAPRPPHRPPDSHAAGEGRLLGHRDQARPAPGPLGLPGVHPQGRHRRLVARLRPPHARQRRRHPPRLRHPQRPQPCHHPGNGRRP